MSGDFTKRPWHGPRDNYACQSMFIILRSYSYYSFLWVFCIPSCLLLSKSISISAQVHRGHYAALMPSPFRLKVLQCSRELLRHQGELLSWSLLILLREKGPSSSVEQPVRINLALALLCTSWVGCGGGGEVLRGTTSISFAFPGRMRLRPRPFLDPQISKLSDGWQLGLYWLPTAWLFSLPIMFYTLYFIWDHSISQDFWGEIPHFCSLDDLCPQSTLQNETET